MQKNIEFFPEIKIVMVYSFFYIYAIAVAYKIVLLHIQAKKLVNKIWGQRQKVICLQ